jgi:GT2 family glycosyltransferase
MKNPITLMMVTYNRLDYTKRTLEGLKKSVSIPFNLVIVDNGSTDGTIDFLDSLKVEDFIFIKSISIIKNKENMGIGIARNQGLAEAKELCTEWYCTIDNDVEMPDGWLSECIDILKHNGSFGCVGVNMEPDPYGIVEMNGRRFQLKPKGNVGTALMVFNSRLIKLLGSFNTEYNLYGEEDADFGMRVRVFGFKMGYIEKMGTHFGGGEVVEGNSYRQFKTKEHNDNLALFKSNCYAYLQRRKSVYIPLKVSK